MPQDPQFSSGRHPDDDARESDNDDLRSLPGFVPEERGVDASSSSPMSWIGRPLSGKDLGACWFQGLLVQCAT